MLQERLRFLIRKGKLDLIHLLALLLFPCLKDRSLPRISLSRPLCNLLQRGQREILISCAVVVYLNADLRSNSAGLARHNWQKEQREIFFTSRSLDTARSLFEEWISLESAAIHTDEQLIHSVKVHTFLTKWSRASARIKRIHRHFLSQFNRSKWLTFNIMSKGEQFVRV